MKQKDLSMKSYLRNNEHYSDLLNAVLFNGETKVLPETLLDVSSSEINQILREEDTTYYEVNRDVLKRGIFKSDGKEVYCLFGVENQTNVDLRMPIRIMEYDALAYKEQVKNYKRSANDSVEFLSRMSRNDKLTPIVTLVFNLSNAKWDGPRSLHDMLATDDEALLKYIPEYKLNLISPYEMSDEEINRFKTPLKYVLACSKYSNDEEGLDKLIKGNEEYKRIDRETMQVIKVHTKMELEINDEEEVIDMCKAIEDMKATSRREGEEKGRKEGKLEGIEEEKMNNIKAFYENGVTIEVIAKSVKLSIEKVREVLGINLSANL